MRETTDRSGPPERSEGGEKRPGFGLSARLLVLTVLFVMLAEVLIYVPSVANFRRNWLADRLAAAQIAALVLEAAPAGSMPRDLERKLLAGVQARAIAIRGSGVRRLVSLEEMPPEVGRVTDLRTASAWDLVRDAFVTLAAPAAMPIRVIGHGWPGVEFVEIVMDETPLRQAMLGFSINILILSLIISGITAGLVFLALQIAIVRPVRRLSANLARFAGNPDDASRIIRPSGRRDEIGVAEVALAHMETALADELRQKRRLADVGLGVSKINHELRNMLTTAQLLSDRLGDLDDPGAKRFVPRLVATLQRAIDFSQATLAYGRAAEPAPQRRPVILRPLVDDLAHLPGLGPEGPVTLAVDVPDDLVIDADPEQLARVLVNLARNAVEALLQTRPPQPRLQITARRHSGFVEIHVSDNGDGIPERAKSHLFEAFKGSARSGGVGLGLAICAEIVRLHGGEIHLEPSTVGAHFRIVIPDRDAG